MSLLMKALEKAAKDRGTAQSELGTKPIAAAPATISPVSELSLEPLAAETPSFAPQFDPDRKSAPSSESSPIPPPAGFAAAPAKTQSGQIKAATVIQAASKRSPSGLRLYLRAHPIVALGSAAGFFLVGFGVYVYLQIFHPGFLIRRPPPAPPLAQAPAQPAPPIATSSLIRPATEPEPPQTGATLPPQSKPAAPAAPSPAAVAETPGNTIIVSRTNTTATVTPLLAEAYAALEANTFDVAQRLYDQLLRNEPKNIDALLGLAAIAAQQGKTDEATRHYLHILELAPRHALAQSGLISLLGRADPLA
ncbi:MAG: tetratricopeptide repeat protein, partial [Burkholderiales bacterium]|nr:tetratricopeptide repeat protein [Burkholderiales bacterium]